jgi:hypothetical protein
MASSPFCLGTKENFPEKAGGFRRKIRFYPSRMQAKLQIIYTFTIARRKQAFNHLPLKVPSQWPTKFKKMIFSALACPASSG